MYTEEFEKAIAVGEAGLAKFSKREFQQARDNCIEACRMLQALLPVLQSPQRKQLAKNFINKYLSVAEQAYGQLKGTQPNVNVRNNGAVVNNQTSTDPFIKEVEANMLEVKNKVSFNDIIGLDHVKQALNQAIIYPALRPDIYKGIRAPPKGILFYGPPGNGKTMLAKAVATESNCTFFNVSSSGLVSKWVGDSERMLKALFECAKKRQPSIIFMDEIDSLLTARSENENEAQRRLKTEFLVQLDGVATTGSDRILVIGATNLPNQLDKAALRRFNKKILIDLPDVKAKKGIISKLLTNTKSKLTDQDITDIAYRMDLYSANDVKAVVKDAAMAPIRQYSYEELLKISKDKLRAIQKKDLVKAIKDNPPNLTAKEYQKYKKLGSSRHKEKGPEVVGSSNTQVFDESDEEYFPEMEVHKQQSSIVGEKNIQKNYKKKSDDIMDEPKTKKQTILNNTTENIGSDPWYMRLGSKVKMIFYQ